MTTFSSDNDVLNILGFSPLTLNVLLELAENSLGINSFMILENMLAENSNDYVAVKDYQVEFLNYYREEQILSNEAMLAFGVCGTKSKKIVYDFFDRGFSLERERFPNLIHSKSEVSKSVNLNFGMQLGPLCSINALADIGFGVTIKNNCYVGHHTIIGDYVEINPGVMICGKVEVGKQTMIGSGTTIRNKIKIGSNCIIGMGSNVTESIPDNALAYGNPCKVQRIINNPN